MNLSVVILAAGQGTRMRSKLPKVLPAPGGRPPPPPAAATARVLKPSAVHIVYGHGGMQVRAALQDMPVRWVEQTQQLGTGLAGAQALPSIVDDEVVLVLYGDVPLTRGDTLQRLLAAAEGGALGLMTAHLDDPSGYGRIIRDAESDVIAIVEHKDASDEQRRINEINTGMLAVNASRLRQWVSALDNKNSQGEFYLTDIIAMAVRDSVPVQTVHPSAVAEIMGINNRAQLAELERIYQRQRAEQLMLQGVTLRDPARLDVRGELEAGRDVMIDVNVVCEGRVAIGNDVVIGPNCYLLDVTIAEKKNKQTNTKNKKTKKNTNTHNKPFARIRPGTVLADDVHVGNFVEVKKSEVGAGSKVNHLSYIGDSTIGRRVNVGAGTITCNYDGANKFQTVIEDDAFIGSDTQLIAPVTVGAGATIGAGSTISKDAPAGELTLSRVPQQTRKGWKRPVKKKAE